MYVTIDMDKLVFLHKHNDHDTCSRLAFLEAPNRSLRVERLDNPAFLSGLSYLDLKLLYGNTVPGAPLSPKSEPTVLREQLQRLVWGWAERAAVPEEVEAQVTAVESDLHKGVAYRYALGAKIPAAYMELFPMTGGYTDMSTAVTEDAHVVAYPWKTSEKAGPADPDKPAPAPKPPREAPNLGRRPSVRPVVFAAADAAWEAAGKPTDDASIKAMRAKVLAELIAQNYHETTVRIKLGEWQRDRLK